MQMEDLEESKHTNTNKNSDCSEKNDNITEEVMLAKSVMSMELSEIFYSIKSAKDKILDADTLRK